MAKNKFDFRIYFSISVNTVLKKLFNYFFFRSNIRIIRILSQMLLFGIFIRVFFRSNFHIIIFILVRTAKFKSSNVCLRINVKTLVESEFQ